MAHIFNFLQVKLGDEKLNWLHFRKCLTVLICVGLDNVKSA